jgi:hypothetical protein
MNVWTKPLLAMVYLLLSSLAFAAGPAASNPECPKPGRAAVPLPDAERYARRCQRHARDRCLPPQGSILWGTKQAWRDSQQGSAEGRSVLVSVDITSPREVDAALTALRLEKGRLVASPQASTSLVGTVLQGTSSDGKSVEVALCGAEPAPEDPDMIWYRIEAWNPEAQEWENPCVATQTVSDPRALAVGGVWDASGARRQVPGRLTLACENGAITKCINWGYKPWTRLGGQSLADLHQACTRMARADYCGNGQSHTHEATLIDMYDRLGVLSVTTEALGNWDPARASFEAAWAPDGAACVSRTRDGSALETILQECPGRFRAGAEVDLGQGDRCTLQREGMSPGAALLHNRSYKVPPGAADQVEGK